MIKRVREVCDENRQPLPVISIGIAARKEEYFNSNGQYDRIFEIGFDEGLVGFSTREAKFYGGALQSVEHKRADGSALSSVRVIITAVVVPPEQPKSAELKVGDQLLSSNGKAVTNGYAWVFAGAFPGGWVEVIRDGKRIRIDGFVAGPLGIGLEDRGK